MAQDPKSMETLSPSDPSILASSQSSPPPPSKVDPYVGKTIDGRYVVERVLGEGGMGVVYAGKHKVIGKNVAIKVLRNEMASDKEVSERFVQEARAASAIGNPHIIDISDFGTLPDGSTYFVMEFLAGKSLSAVISEVGGPMPVPRLSSIAKQIGQALSAAHTVNIVHRDLKPDNVMLVARGSEKDFVKILDFGIAKVGGGTNKVTRAGSIFGTPHYMSPEQAAGAAVDHRTDIYALGVILYEMATGRLPFDADNFMGILTQHMYKSPVPMRALVPEVGVPAGLDAIVLKCLTKKPEGRYQSMDELVADFEKLDKGLLPDAVQELMARSGGFNVPADYFRTPSMMPAPVPASPSLPKQRWPMYAAIGGGGVVAAIAVVLFLGRGGGDPAHAQPATSSAQTAAASTPSSTAAAAPIPSTTAPATAQEQAAAPAKHQVLVSVIPPDATIVRDGNDLGGAPVAIELNEGEHASLVVSRKGYKTKTVAITSDEPKLTITLEGVAMGGTGRPGGGGGRHPGGVVTSGGDDDPFNHH
jgi:serine/threonine-protein kinase